jgi:hypothetical protein
VLPSGITSARPTTTVVGQVYFDTTLSLPVFATTTSGGWVNAAGVSA